MTRYLISRGWQLVNFLVAIKLLADFLHGSNICKIKENGTHSIFFGLLIALSCNRYQFAIREITPIKKATKTI